VPNTFHLTPHKTTVAEPAGLWIILRVSHEQLTTHEKALKINVDGLRYGAFAEIGAGQEVARWFFRVGGAAGTVAKTMSAYDMAVSDAIYGSGQRYVSRQRLQSMLAHEWDLLLERLATARGGQTYFFVFADTVATRSYSRKEDGVGWLGVRFQAAPLAAPSEIIIHTRLWEADPVRQQESLGILGVNLMYGAFYHADDPVRLIGTLLDDLSRNNVEVDMIKCSGPAFPGVDNRLLTLQLVEQGLTDAAMFTAAGDVIEPAELLYKKPILVARGSYRPVTNVTVDMLDRARDQLLADPQMQGQAPVVLLEMTLRNLLQQGVIDHRDFLARVDMLGALGHPVMISSHATFHRLTRHLRRFTDQRIASVLGIPTLEQIFDEKYYGDLEGGILEGLGRLFKGDVKLYVYPFRHIATGELVTAENMRVSSRLRHLYAHMIENEYIEPLRKFDAGQLHIFPREVLTRIEQGDPSWETMVPAPVVTIIKARGFFGYRAA